MESKAPKLPPGYIAVTSSNLKAVKFTACKDEACDCPGGSGHLEIMYINGTQYLYYAVPHHSHRTIMESASPGRAFGTLILKADPKFKCERLVPVVPAPVAP